MWKFYLALGLIVFAHGVANVSVANASEANPRVVYGVDNRHEVYQDVSPQRRALARSVVTLVFDRDLVENPDGSFGWDTSSLGEADNLCSSQRFWHEPTVGFCSGFLLSPSLVVTAGHCLHSEFECQNTSFIFDYAKYRPGRVRRIERKNIYHCGHVMYEQLNGQGADFAIATLKRPLLGRKPLAVRRTGSIGVHQPVFVIGSPSGIPLKIAGGAAVRRLAKGFFVANLDTFDGNSGSPVFNAKTLKVEGIVVRGAQDWVWSKDHQCRIVNVCPSNGCRGEDVTSMSAILPYAKPQSF